jgi:hypothetical protein
MTTYKGINGFAVQSVATDPSPLDEGQVWYNNASYAFKLATLTTSGTWASGGNMNTARRIANGGVGIQTAALAISGSTPGAGALSAVESYNGTSWTTNPVSVNTGRPDGAASGTQTAALFFGGAPNYTNTEKWNGSTWTNNPTGLNTGRSDLAASGSGPSTATITFGGYQYGVGAVGVSESWNGSIWTNTPSLNTARDSLTGLGIQTAALAISGPTGVGTESWNGSVWTASANVNTARYDAGASGTQTSGLFFGGAGTAPGASVTGATELWNGTSWTSNPTGLATARRLLGGAGTQTAGIAFGGFTDTVETASTEEWTGPGSPVTKTITTS